MEMTEYEYAVSQKSEGKFLLIKCMLLLLYAVFMGAFFLACYISRIIPLFAVSPIFLWMLVFFTWKYCKPDYKYVISESFITFYKVLGKKKKEITKIKIAEAEYIIPLETALDEITAYQPKKTFSARPSLNAADSYVMLYKEKDGTRCAFIFVATSKALAALRFYNKKTVMSKTAI